MMGRAMIGRAMMGRAMMGRFMMGRAMMRGWGTQVQTPHQHSRTTATPCVRVCVRAQRACVRSAHACARVRMLRCMSCLRVRMRASRARGGGGLCFPSA